MSQLNDIVDYMREHGSITQKQATRYCGSTRLPARILDLKKRGYKIDDEFIDVRCRGGRKTQVKRYWIREDEEDAKQDH